VRAGFDGLRDGQSRWVRIGGGVKSEEPVRSARGEGAPMVPSDADV